MKGNLPLSAKAKASKQRQKRKAKRDAKKGNYIRVYTCP